MTTTTDTMTAHYEWQRQSRIASTITAQVPTMLRLAVGWRNPVLLPAPHVGLQVQVRGTCTKYVQVHYDEARDLYDVTVRNKTRRNAAGEWPVKLHACGLDTGQMVAVFDRIDRGEL